MDPESQDTANLDPVEGQQQLSSPDRGPIACQFCVRPFTRRDTRFPAVSRLGATMRRKGMLSPATGKPAELASPVESKSLRYRLEREAKRGSHAIDVRG
ncbi:hypothetical protein AARAC_001247 [Aspergillus arachidicola]|uniref:Uncharacterized protein n=1 Tax=Aspergillus arachidicola TaxID=656916 RepID=A0A2G7FR38_9EURO|nr:hypothetical protein AARAC_001247 [Aspergillus arachidicola]